MKKLALAAALWMAFALPVMASITDDLQSA